MKPMTDEEYEQALEERRRDAVAQTALHYGARPIDVPMLVAGAQRETDAVRAARTFAESRQTMLVLAGPVGTGKTVALGWLLVRAASRYQHLVERWNANEAPEPRGIGPRLITAAALSRFDRFDEDAMRELMRAPLVALDDLGAEHADRGGWLLAFVDELVNERYAAGLRTAITTNLGARSFTQRYGKRIIDRVAEAGTFVELRGESMRGKAVP